MAQIAIKNVVNATVRMDNSDDTDRKYIITADVNIAGSKVDNIQNGSVTATNGQGSGSFAYYYYGNDLPQTVNINFDAGQDYTSRTAMMEAVEEFTVSATNAAAGFGVSITQA